MYIIIFLATPYQKPPPEVTIASCNVVTIVHCSVKKPCHADQGLILKCIQLQQMCIPDL